MKGEIAKLCDAIMRGEDWTGGEPSLGTCSCIASIKREAARLEAIENKSLTQPQPEAREDIADSCFEAAHAMPRPEALRFITSLIATHCDKSQTVTQGPQPTPKPETDGDARKLADKFLDSIAEAIDAAFARIREEAVQKTAETAVHEILCNWMAHDEDDPGDARYVEHHTKHLVPTIVAAARVAILGTGDKL